MSRNIKLFKALNDIDNQFLMDSEEKNNTVFKLKYFKYAAACVVVAIIGVGGYKLLKSENNLSSQGDSNPTSDYQTDVKVLHPGDKEPEDKNETFVYQVTPEEEEKMRQEAEEYKRQKEEELENNFIPPTDEEIAKRQEELEKVDNIYQQLVKEGRDMIVRYNGEETVKKYEEARDKSNEQEKLDDIRGITEGTAKLWELYINTIWEHDDEITDSERAIIMITVSPNGLDYYAQKHEEYRQVYDMYRTLKAKHRDFEDVFAKRLSGE